MLHVVSLICSVHVGFIAVNRNSVQQYSLLCDTFMKVI